MVFGSVNTLLFIAWHFETTSGPRKRERNIWVPRYALWFSSQPHWRRKKENDDFRFFSKFVFLASIKLSGNQRTYLYSGGSGLSIDIHFVDIELSYDVLSPLPIVLSKHFNHPHPYKEIATAISDIMHTTVNREIFVLKNVHAIIFHVKIFSYASRPYENILITKIFNNENLEHKVAQRILSRER